MHVHIHAHTHTQTHTRTHAHTQAHTCTYTYTFLQPGVQPDGVVIAFHESSSQAGDALFFGLQAESQGPLQRLLPRSVRPGDERAKGLEGLVKELGLTILRCVRLFVCVCMCVCCAREYECVCMCVLYVCVCVFTLDFVRVCAYHMPDLPPVPVCCCSPPLSILQGRVRMAPVSVCVCLCVRAHMCVCVCVCVCVCMCRV